MSCEELLRREDFRCNEYNFDSSTKKQLLDRAHRTLIESYSGKLLDLESVGKLIDNNEIESMKGLYQLLRLSGIEQQLRGPWEAHIKRTGSGIINDASRGDEMIIRLLELRRSSDIMIRDAFAGNESFTFGLREAFGHFINDTKAAESSYQTGTSKLAR